MSETNRQPPIGLQYPERLDPYTRAELEQIIAALNRRLDNVTGSIPSGLVAAPQPIFFGISGREGRIGREGIPGTIGVNGAAGANGAPGFSIPGRDGESPRSLSIPGRDGAAGSPGLSDWVKIQRIKTTGSQATVDFTSIPAIYESLVVVWQGKDTTAGNSVSNVRLKINNDGTSGNYTVTGESGSTNGTGFTANDAASAAGGVVGNLTNTGTTSQIGCGRVLIPSYAGTTFFKGVKSEWGNFSTTTNVQVGDSYFSWKSAAAINQLTFSCGTAFVDDSVFTLYGLTGATPTTFWTDVVAAADQSVASSTTVANDNELFFTMVANKLYAFEAHIIYNSPAGGTTPDFKFAFAGPATLTGARVLQASYLSLSDANGTAQNGIALTTTDAVGTATTARHIKLDGWAFSTGGGVGASGLIFQWAQNTSGVNPTVRLAGSVLRWRQLSA
jgi:hypothetical protein